MAVSFHDLSKPAWLASEPKWTARLGEGWEGTKFLGKGSSGIVGLWEYKGGAEGAPAIKKVVVKQTEAAESTWGQENRLGYKSPLDEGRFLEILVKVGSKHIIRQYGGNRRGDCFQDMHGVVRIFLEFCAGGDMAQFISDVQQPRKPPLAEVDVWALFHYIALAITAVDRGTEAGHSSPWRHLPARRKIELVHFDIKADNIFIGDLDPDHLRMPIAKLADFGESYEVPLPKDQTDEYGGRWSDRGMEFFNPPEEVINHPNKSVFAGVVLKNPRKGTCSNIRQVGAMMNCLLLGTHVDFNDPDNVNLMGLTKIPTTSRVLKAYVNHSLFLDTPEITERYSSTLISLIQECLLRPSLERPSSTDLVKRTLMGLSVALDNSQKLNLVAPMDEFSFAAVEDLEPPTEWETERFLNEWGEPERSTTPLPPSMSTSSFRSLVNNISRKANALRSKTPPTPESSSSTTPSPPPRVSSSASFPSIFRSRVTKPPSPYKTPKS